MNQLGLPISFNPQISLENFIANEQITNLIQSSFTSNNNLKLYVYGSSGSGKTHILKAVVLKAIEMDIQSVFIDCKEDIPDYLLDIIKDLKWLSIDNIGSINASQQHILFDIYNIAAQANVNIISSADLPPKNLNIIKDIKTRLSLANVFSLDALNDIQIQQVLNHRMQENSILVDEKVYKYLFKYYSRDIKILLKALDSLDKASIESKQNISIFLVKKTLNI